MKKGKERSGKEKWRNKRVSSARRKIQMQVNVRRTRKQRERMLGGVITARSKVVRRIRKREGRITDRAFVQCAVE